MPTAVRAATAFVVWIVVTGDACVSVCCARQSLSVRLRLIFPSEIQMGNRSHFAAFLVLLVVASAALGDGDANAAGAATAGGSLSADELAWMRAAAQRAADSGPAAHGAPSATKSAPAAAAAAAAAAATAAVASGATATAAATGAAATADADGGAARKSLAMTKESIQRLLKSAAAFGDRAAAGKDSPQASALKASVAAAGGGGAAAATAAAASGSDVATLTASSFATAAASAVRGDGPALWVEFYVDWCV